MTLFLKGAKMLLKYLILKAIENEENPFLLTAKRKFVYSQIAHSLQELEYSGLIIRENSFYKLTDIGFTSLQEMCPKRYKIYSLAKFRLDKSKTHDIFIPKKGWNK